MIINLDKKTNICDATLQFTVMLSIQMFLLPLNSPIAIDNRKIFSVYLLPFDITFMFIIDAVAYTVESTLY